MIEIGKRYLIKIEELGEYFGCPKIVYKEIIVDEFSLNNEYVRIRIDGQPKWCSIKSLEIVSELKSFSEDEIKELKSFSEDEIKEIKDKYYKQYKGH